MNNTVQTRHYGLVARHWAEKNTKRVDAEANADHDVIVYFARK